MSFKKFTGVQKGQKLGLDQEGYIEEVTRLSQCLNAKTGFVHF